jgi:transcriptional regulator with XRE-family HTH domain
VSVVVSLVSSSEGQETTEFRSRALTLMAKNPESLGDFIRRVRTEKGLSLADVERESARHGRRIAGSYVNRIENGVSNRPTADRLEAIARGLRIPVEELFAHATGKGLVNGADADRMRALAMFDGLSPERRADVLKLLEMWYGEEVGGRRRRPA